MDKLINLLKDYQKELIQITEDEDYNFLINTIENIKNNNYGFTKIDKEKLYRLLENIDKEDLEAIYIISNGVTNKKLKIEYDDTQLKIINKIITDLETKKQTIEKNNIPYYEDIKLTTLIIKNLTENTSKTYIDPIFLDNLFHKMRITYKEATQILLTLIKHNLQIKT